LELESASRFAKDEWGEFAAARTGEALCEAWLVLLCRRSEGARAGLVLLKQDDGSFAPMASWPAALDPATLGDVAREALTKREGVVQQGAHGEHRFAYPLLVSGEARGAVIIELAACEAARLAAMRLTHWGAGWLLDLLNRRAAADKERRLAQSEFLFDVVLAAQAEPDLHKASLAIVNRLAQRFACQRVMFALERSNSARVIAVSHSAVFEEKATLLHAAAQAMNEAFDQRARIAFPEPPGSALLAAGMHRRFAEESGSAALCSCVLEAGGSVQAVCLLERDKPFTAEELEFLDLLAAALAPVVESRRAASETLAGHAVRSLRRFAETLTGGSYPALKLGGVLVAALVTAAASIPLDYRVSAPALVEGSLQRASVAAFQGYIREAPARAGDEVREGQTLALLEDKDLQLERQRWEAEVEVARQRAREARGAADRVALRLAGAQMQQANAQLQLVLENLARARVAAPFDGVVVRGDLTQQLGSPVERGTVLFEVAPLDAWRVIVKVDERDIIDVHEGRLGELVLASMPGERLPFRVKRVTPVSTQQEGRNYFRVEAEMLEGGARLRPGMEGVAKVEAGARTLLWIWTHRLVDWLALTWWEWAP
jgi:RND family efflux transporter MFP subunit